MGLSDVLGGVLISLGGNVVVRRLIAFQRAYIHSLQRYYTFFFFSLFCGRLF